MKFSSQSGICRRLSTLTPLFLGLILAGCDKKFLNDNVLGNPDKNASPVTGAIDRTKFPAEYHKNRPDAPKVNKNQNEHLVALILPTKSTNPRVQKVADSMLKAAKLAEKDVHEKRLKLYILENDGSSKGVTQSANYAVDAGAELILGPLLKENVSDVQHIVSGRNIPIVGFSSDSSIAKENTYLLSYLPEQDVDKISEYASSVGIKSVAVLYPQNTYGGRLNSLFQKISKDYNLKVVASEPYTLQTIDQTTQKLASNLDFKSAPNAVFIPENPSRLSQVLASLKKNSIDPQNTLILGTGFWQDRSIIEQTKGASVRFPVPAEDPMRLFVKRYKGEYKTPPSELSALSYDAVTLAAGLISRRPSDPFTADQITNPSGFSGVTGLFRFHDSGLSERGLAIAKIEGGRLVMERPALQKFSN